jgi:hypothetical protein
VSAPITATNTLAIAGYVDDAQTGAPIAGAVVAISAGPPAFESLRAVLSSLPGWASAADRLDRTSTRVDGRFVFVNLPDGSYTLAVSAPCQPGRYATGTAAATAGQASAPVVVALTPPGPAAPASAPPEPATPRDAPPPPSPETARIVGRVVRRSNRKPVAGALVQVRGTDRSAHTAADGSYAIEGVGLGSTPVEISAEQFELARRQIHLEAGEQRRLHVHLRRTHAAPAANDQPAPRGEPPQGSKRGT